MKANAHPQVHQTRITCGGCDSVYTIPTTLESLHVEVCSNCHPLFTGVEKFIDTEGRIEKFQKRAAMKVETKKREVEVKQQERKSLRDMLQEVRNATQES